MLAQAVESDLPRAENLVAQDGVGREGVEAGRMIRLIERELEVDRLAVDRDVRVARPRQVDDAIVRMPK